MLAQEYVPGGDRNCKYTFKAPERITMNTPSRAPNGPGPRAGGTEITRFELERIFAGKEDRLATLLAYLGCPCDAPGRHIVRYKVYVNELYDLILRGACSACGAPAARYLETGDDRGMKQRVRKALRARGKDVG